MARHRLRARLGAVVALVGALVLLAAGCSSDGDRLDRAGTETSIARVVEDDLSRTVDQVTCPDHISREVGNTIRCELVLEGVEGRVGVQAVQQADESLDVILSDAVIDPADVADQLERQLLATYLRTFTADCGGSGPRALAPGDTVPCTVADDDGERQATASVVDAAGSLHFAVAEAAPSAEEPDLSEGTATPRATTSTSKPST